MAAVTETATSVIAQAIVINARVSMFLMAALLSSM
jgi:hypothetical protein